MSIVMSPYVDSGTVVLRLPVTPAGFAKGFAFCKTRRCTKSRRASYVAKPAGDVTEARRDFVTSVTCMSSGGLRSTFLSRYDELDAR